MFGKSARLLGIVVVLTLVGRGVLATCGGGGGGGGGSMNAYQTTWTEWLAALSQATEKKTGVLLYFRPGDDGAEHGVFKSKPIAEESVESPMVKLRKVDADKLRTNYEIPAAGHHIIVTDWYGNRIRVFSAKEESARVPADKILAAVKGANGFVEKLRKEAATKVERAEKSVEKEDWKKAIGQLEPLLVLLGIDERKRADELLAKVLTAGRERIATAVEGKDEKELRKIAREFRGCEVETEAEAAIADLGGEHVAVPAAYRDRSAALAVWTAFADSIELPRVPAETWDRWMATQRELKEGSRAEAQHLYDFAKRHYEAALALDSEDAVVHRYLGEFHRHHTGDWNLARQHFEAIVADWGADSYSRAIALHGIGKMTIHDGEFKKGVTIMEQSIEVLPTQLAYRNLAVYWNSENEREKARGYARKAFELDPSDPYTRIFEAVYRTIEGDRDGALALIDSTSFEASMSYNLACIHSTLGEKERALGLLERHFWNYESNDRIREKEMWEARSDINFAWLHQDPDFLRVTSLR